MHDSSMTFDDLIFTKYWSKTMKISQKWMDHETVCHTVFDIISMIFMPGLLFHHFSRFPWPIQILILGISETNQCLLRGLFTGSVHPNKIQIVISILRNPVEDLLLCGSLHWSDVVSREMIFSAFLKVNTTFNHWASLFFQLFLKSTLHLTIEQVYQPLLSLQY